MNINSTEQNNVFSLNSRHKEMANFININIYCILLIVFKQLQKATMHHEQIYKIYKHAYCEILVCVARVTYSLGNNTICVPLDYESLPKHTVSSLFLKAYNLLYIKKKKCKM